MHTRRGNSEVMQFRARTPGSDKCNRTRLYPYNTKINIMLKRNRNVKSEYMYINLIDKHIDKCCIHEVSNHEVKCSLTLGDMLISYGSCQFTTMD